MPDPECWVPDGYIVIRVDARGCGKSPGSVRAELARGVPRFLRCDRMGGRAALVQRQGRAHRHLLSRCRPVARRLAEAAASLRALPVDGHLRLFRDRTRQDGIYGSGFISRWWARSVLRNQHGNGESPYHDLYTGGKTTGDQALTPEQLAANRADYPREILAHPLNDKLLLGPHARSRRRSINRFSSSPIGAGSRSICAARSAAIWVCPRRTSGHKIQSGSYIHTYLPAAECRDA